MATAFAKVKNALKLESESPNINFIWYNTKKKFHNFVWAFNKNIFQIVIFPIWVQTDPRFGMKPFICLFGHVITTKTAPKEQLVREKKFLR